MHEKPAIDLTQLQEIQQTYVKHLFSFVSEYSRQVIESLPSPAETPIHAFQPGDQVLVRSLKPKEGEPRFGPPTQVLLVTRTAVKIKGQPQWIHASRVKAAPQTVMETVESETLIPSTSEAMPSHNLFLNKGSTD
uniref:Murine leukemia virus integrase C-terminal domain-containing protein n=1 Tax=Labrus bergylta TaxID=56723 RepID=A0A3Q3FI14_9LABR